MKSVFVVTGETGQYSDHCEWNVCAFTDRDEATEHAELAEARAARIDWLSEDDVNEYDPGMRKHGDPVYYRVEEVPLRERAGKLND